VGSWWRCLRPRKSSNFGGEERGWAVEKMAWVEIVSFLGVWKGLGWAWLERCWGLEGALGLEWKLDCFRWLGSNVLSLTLRLWI
jgi:hypothetical protein